MRPDDRIDEWARARARTVVPAGFADRVVAASTARTEARRSALRVAALLTGAVLAALRVAAALAVFLPR